MLANSIGKNLHWILKNLSVHGAAIKFKPLSLSKCRKAYLFIVRKYSTLEVVFKYYTCQSKPRFMLTAGPFPELIHYGLAWTKPISNDNYKRRLHFCPGGHLSEFTLWSKREKNKRKQMKRDSTSEEFTLSRFWKPSWWEGHHTWEFSVCMRS